MYLVFSGTYTHLLVYQIGKQKNGDIDITLYDVQITNKSPLRECYHDTLKLIYFYIFHS